MVVLVNLYYYYGSQKLATKSDGISVTGHTETDTLRVSGVSTFQGNVNLGDNDRLKFGDGGDLQIFHDGSVSKIADTGVGLQTGGCFYSVLCQQHKHL